MTTMASATAVMLPFTSSSCLCSPPTRAKASSVNSLAQKMKSLKLSSSNNISLSLPIFPLKFSPVSNNSFPSLSIFAHKGYKMKTHKASAKRFRVTGRGKIVRRRAGKQHLLAKKNAKRRARLSKTVAVNRSDYDNVIGALPYLKVNRNAT